MRILLIRHANHDALNRVLCGRSFDIPLNADGRRQAEILGAALAEEEEPVLQSSPRRRAVETARRMADSCGGELEVVEALDEIEFGEWSGRSFESLEGCEAWRRWNSARAQSRPPGGERMVDVQARIAAHFDRVRQQYPAATVAMVTHADVIRAAICHVLGLSCDQWQRIEIAPASISALEGDGGGYRLISMNEVWS